MARKSEQAELIRRIKEIKSQLRERASSRRKVDAPVETPLRLELRVAEAKLALVRADRRQSKFLIKKAQMELNLARAEQDIAASTPGTPRSEPLPFTN